MQIHVDEPALLLASDGSVLFSVWRGRRMKPPVATSIHEHGIALARTRPGSKIALWTVIGPRTPPPSEDVRRVIASSAMAFMPHLAASPLTYDGAGFRAAIVRGVVTSMNALEHAPLPEAVLDSHEKAAELIRSRLAKVDVDLAVPDLMRIFGEVIAKAA